MSAKTEATQLADALERIYELSPDDWVAVVWAARELRRLESENEQLKRSMESQKDEWLSWAAKRAELEREARRALFIQSGEPYIVTMKKTTVIFDPNPEPEWQKAWCDAIDEAIASKEQP